MSTVTKYLVYGPPSTLRRLPAKLLEQNEPKFLYTYDAPAGDDKIYVAVFEQYEKQINATITLTCIIECNNTFNRIEMKKSGGRMGFRGSSLSEEKSIEADVVDFIMDYSKRFGLSLQEEQDEKPAETTDNDNA
jgi:hypothetical protein